MVLPNKLQWRKYENIMVNYDQSPGQSAWGMAEIGISWRPKGSQKPIYVTKEVNNC